MSFSYNLENDLSGFVDVKINSVMLHAADRLLKVSSDRIEPEDPNHQSFTSFRFNDQVTITLPYNFGPKDLNLSGLDDRTLNTLAIALEWEILEREAQKEKDYASMIDRDPAEA